MVCLVLVVLNIRVPVQGSYSERVLQSERIRYKKIGFNDDKKVKVK